MNEISERHKKGFLPPRLSIFQFLNCGGVAERSRVRLQLRVESGLKDSSRLLRRYVGSNPTPSFSYKGYATSNSLKNGKNYYSCARRAETA